ncbi:family 43 glycosylhydrolase [Pedobacter sp. PWIIR3]
MTRFIFRISALAFLFLFSSRQSDGQSKTADSADFYNSVRTYVNPVLPGDHPDPTLLKVGDDFYHCGSTFHFNPYMPIYHSKDLVHWELISRVLTKENAGWVSDKPSAGIWQGAITYFYGSYWIYFSAGGQWFSKADSPKGPWSKPVQVKSNPQTGNLGYDNSIFVDDDGKPYMVIKNGQKVNRLQELGKDGQLTGQVINLDWINAKLQYSWAEGPVMCKRNGYYYYFPAGDVSGGQYVLRATALTSDSTKWERLGNFFKPITDAKVGFRSPNHIAAPIMLSDGTWWTIGQSYEKYDNNDWSGMGRQTALYPVIWEGDRPWGMAPTTAPIIKPNLPKSGISWRSVKTDYFDTDQLDLCWHFLNKAAAGQYTLSQRKGWVRLSPDTGLTHLVQKETDHFYTAVTKVDFDANSKDAGAGIYLTSGNRQVVAKLYSGFNDGRKINFKVGNGMRIVENTSGGVVWLKLVREEHLLSGFFSNDGKTWKSLGAPLSSDELDKAQPNFNSWVGTSVGLFAEGKPADFDFFICKDGSSALTLAGYSNYFGVTSMNGDKGKVVTNTSSKGGWLMLSGVEFGQQSPLTVQLLASSKFSGMLELWVDDLQTGKLIAKIPFQSTVGKWQSIRAKLKKVSGQHDLFIKFPAGQAGQISLSTIQFIP